MATNKISPCSYVIHPEGESMLSEGAYVVSRDDEGAGEFLTVEDGMGNKVRFDLDEVARWVESRFRSHYAPIIVVAEGAQPTDGHLVTKDQSLDAFGHVSARFGDHYLLSRSIAPARP